MRFHTTILQADKNATGIQIPAEVVESLGAGKRPPVRITINGYTYRNTVAVMGGVFMVGVSAEHRKGAGVAGGDEVAVEIELDTEPVHVDRRRHVRRVERVHGYDDGLTAAFRVNGATRITAHQARRRRDPPRALRKEPEILSQTRAFIR